MLSHIMTSFHTYNDNNIIHAIIITIICVVVISHDTTILITESGEGATKEERKEKVGTVLTLHSAPPVDTTVLITGSGDSLVKLWDVETGKEIYNLPHKVPVKSVEFAEGDKQFLVLTDNVMGHSSTVSIYALNDGRPAGNPHEIVVKDVKLTYAMWGPLNKTIIISAADGSIRVYDADTLKLVQENKEHTKIVNKMAFDKDKFTFISASGDQTAKLFDTKTLTVLKSYDTGRPVNAAAISPIKEHVIIGGGQSAESVTTQKQDSSQFKVRFFHKIFNEELGSLPGHFGPVETLAFSPDGHSFVSGGWDGYIRIHHFDDSYFKEE